MNFLDLIWLIPFVPLLGAALMLFFGRRLPKAAISLICPGAVCAAARQEPGSPSEEPRWN